MTTHQNLERLIELANEPSSEKRRELLTEITDIFLGPTEPLSERESALCGDIMEKVAFNVEAKVREQLSDRLADVDFAPRDLIKRLAHDAIEVARPILERSKVLDESELIEVVRERGQEHQLAVTRRDEVSEGVADALVEHGSDEVLVSLVQNDGAQLSRNAVETLVAKSETSEVLQAPLVQRSDVPADLMHEMFWFVSSALREHILTVTDIDEAEVDALLAEAEKEMTEAAQANEAAMSRAEREVRRFQRLGQLNEAMMIKLLREKQTAHFVYAFALLCDIDSATAKRIISDEGHEALVVACKSSGFDRSTFSTILLLTIEGGKQPRRGDDVADLLGLYDNVPPAMAQRAMRFWRVRATGNKPETPAADAQQPAAG